MDISEAKKLSKETNKPILIVFQGSDWCAPCIKLTREILNTEEFVSYSKDNFIMLKVDFPKKKKNSLNKKQQEHNNTLAEKFNKYGYFPYIVMIDEEERMLGSTGYKKVSPEEYIKLLQSFISY